MIYCDFGRLEGGSCQNQDLREWGTCDESHYYEQQGNSPCLLLGGIRVGNRSSLLQSRKESGLQSPPTREFRRTEEGNLKLYLTFVRK